MAINIIVEWVHWLALSVLVIFSKYGCGYIGGCVSFFVVGIMVGMFSHIFCGGQNGGYDEYSQKLWQ